MNLTCKDLLKHSFVITIDDKRFEWFKKVFEFHGLSPLPKKFMGTTLWYNTPKYNCYLSHKNAILKAKKLKWPYVCIFEDDAYPINHVKNLIDMYLMELPDDCKVFVLGNILLWDIRGEYGDFYRSFRTYGGHAYVVFKDVYDEFIEMLDENPEGDGAFYSRMDCIIPKDSFFTPKKNLFIQYTNSNSIHSPGGYVYIDINKLHIKDGKTILPKDNSIPDEQVVKMGFPLISEIQATLQD